MSHFGSQGTAFMITSVFHVLFVGEDAAIPTVTETWVTCIAKVGPEPRSPDPRLHTFLPMCNDSYRISAQGQMTGYCPPSLSRTVSSG